MSNNFEAIRDTRNMSMNHDFETGVSLLDSVNKTCVKRRIAEISRWRHIRLAIKARFLENHAFQIKSYYGTLSGSHDRSVRIRREEVRAEPPGGGLTSYPVCNETLLTGKLCTRIKNFYGTLSGSHGRSFRIGHEKCVLRPLAETDDDVIFGLQ